MSSSGHEIHYRMATPKQYPKIMDMLYQSFFADEPMTSTLGITDGKKRVDVSIPGCSGEGSYYQIILLIYAHACSRC